MLSSPADCKKDGIYRSSTHSVRSFNVHGLPEYYADESSTPRSKERDRERAKRRDMFENDEVKICILLAGHHMYEYFTHEKRWNKITALVNKKARSFNPNVILKEPDQVEKLYRSILQGWLQPRGVLSDWANSPLEGVVRKKIDGYIKLDRRPDELPAGGRGLLMGPIKEEEENSRYLLEWHDSY